MGIYVFEKLVNAVLVQNTFQHFSKDYPCAPLLDENKLVKALQRGVMRPAKNHMFPWITYAILPLQILQGVLPQHHRDLGGSRAWISSCIVPAIIKEAFSKFAVGYGETKLPTWKPNLMRLPSPQQRQGRKYCSTQMEHAWQWKVSLHYGGHRSRPVIALFSLKSFGYFVKVMKRVMISLSC